MTTEDDELEDNDDGTSSRLLKPKAWSIMSQLDSSVLRPSRSSLASITLVSENNSDLF
jgi:hypothetical protein